ncbi:MAG: phosphatase PAP2 family protein [Treponema sp.]|jgi:hypothetical protein|nr:phosphatase PAP2 family protein [Treponema sp.]
MELLKFLEGIRAPFLDTVIGLITRLGEETTGIVILCLIFWCISKRIAYGIGITYFLSGLTVQGMKICFRIDRPWAAYPSLNPVPSALKHATGYSFPSGHTQSAAALFGSLGAQVKNIPFKTICFTLAVLVAFSRLYLGVHTLLDVSVSLMICFLFIMLTLKFTTGGTVDKKKELIICGVMVLYAAVVIIIASALYAGGRIEYVYLSDCLKAAGASIGFSVGMYIERVYIDFPVKAKNIFLQILKFFLGLIGVLVIKEGLKLLIGTGLVVDTIRYFLMLTWITAFYPLVIKRFFAG